MAYRFDTEASVITDPRVLKDKDSFNLDGVNLISSQVPVPGNSNPYATSNTKPANSNPYATTNTKPANSNPYATTNTAPANSNPYATTNNSRKANIPVVNPTATRRVTHQDMIPKVSNESNNNNKTGGEQNLRKSEVIQQGGLFHDLIPAKTAKNQIPDGLNILAKSFVRRHVKDQFANALVNTAGPNITNNIPQNNQNGIPPAGDNKYANMDYMNVNLGNNYRLQGSMRAGQDWLQDALDTFKAFDYNRSYMVQMHVFPALMDSLFKKFNLPPPQINDMLF